MDLIIIRHARPERADGVHATADPPLSESGRQQAEATAAFLAGEPVHHIVSSPLRRAQQTAEPLAARLGIDLETNEGLREIDPFGGSYVPAEELGADHHVVQTFVGDRFALFDSVGGIDVFRSTVVNAFDAVIAANRGRRVAVFTHGMVLGCYLTALVGHQDPFVLVADYCGIYRVEAAANGIRTLRSANETGHVRHLLVEPLTSPHRP